MARHERSWVGITVSGGRYELLSLIGGGAMGSVYLAKDRNLDTEVAVKIPRQSMLEDPDFAPRFAREIRALVRLRHPHIVKISEVGDHDGTPFAIMQYLRGGDMESRRPLRPDGTVLAMPPESLDSWLPGIADALDFMHAKGYIHRDIKPANIIFDEVDHAYLGDFGVVGALADTPAAATRAMTAAGLVVGTPEYMAPEIIMGEPFDGRADQYSLAVMVYELLAGRRPFEGNNAAALIVQQSTQPPPPLREFAPRVSEKLARVVHRGLEKQPELRFENCAAFARAALKSSKEVGLPLTITSVTPEVRSVPCPECGTILKLLSKYVAKRLVCPACRLNTRVLHDLSLERIEEPGSRGTAKLKRDPSPEPPAKTEEDTEFALLDDTDEKHSHFIESFEEAEPQSEPKFSLGGETFHATPAGAPDTGTAKISDGTTFTRAKLTVGIQKHAAIVGASAFGVLCLAFLIYLNFFGPEKPPEVIVGPPPAAPPKGVAAPLYPTPVEKKRPKRPKLPEGFLVLERFETDDIQEGKLPGGWDGNLTVFKNPEAGTMELSLPNDHEVGSVVLTLPDNKKIYGDFECQVRFLLPEVAGKVPDSKSKSTYVTVSLTNSPQYNHDLFLEIGSTRDFGTVKVFEKLSDAEEATYETVGRFPAGEPSELLFRRKSGQYQVFINKKLVEKLRFPKYDGSFDQANLALRTPATEARPRIVSVGFKADGESPRQELADTKLPPSPAADLEKPRPPVPSASPAPKPLAKGLMVDFSRSSLDDWGGDLPVDLKRYYIRNEDQALALRQPGLSFNYPFIDHGLEQPIEGDFVLSFELKIPNVNSELVIRRHPTEDEPILIMIYGDGTYSINNGAQSLKKKPLRIAKVNVRNRFELRRQGDRLELKVGGTSIASLPNRLGAGALDGVGIRMSTDYQVKLSPLLYSLELQPLNP